MIKYPAYLGSSFKRGFTEIFPVLDGGDARTVCECYEKSDAKDIVNALNAIHDCEAPTRETFPDKSSRSDVDHLEIGLWYEDWYKKYIKKEK